MLGRHAKCALATKYGKTKSNIYHHTQAGRRRRCAFWSGKRSTLLAVVPKDLKMINKLHLSTLYRQIGMNQRILTTLVRTQACKSEMRVNLMEPRENTMT